MIAPWLQACLQQVQVLKQSNRLSHALLVTGADGAGQEQLARQIVHDLMCEEQQLAACGHCHSCQLMSAGTHPDFRVLEGESGTIKIDQIRTLVQKISQKSQVGHNKVVLISHAQTMNINAANALLKALEEPSSRTFFVLTSSQSTSLLPTIRSRCLLVNVPTPNLQEVEGWLSQQDDGNDLKSLFWLTTQPFRLLSIQKQGNLSLYTNLPTQLCDFLDKKATLNSLFKGLDNGNVNDYCNGLSAILHQCICHTTGSELDPNLQTVFPILMSRLGIQGLMLRYQALQKLKLDLQKTNLNPIMQLTHELNQW